MKQKIHVDTQILKDFKTIKVIHDEIKDNVSHEKEKSYLEKLRQKEKVDFIYPIDDKPNLRNLLIDDGILYNEKIFLSNPENTLID